VRQKLLKGERNKLSREKREGKAKGRVIKMRVAKGKKNPSISAPYFVH
jgi:hypothetical protein